MVVVVVSIVVLAVAMTVIRLVPGIGWVLHLTTYGHPLEVATAVLFCALKKAEIKNLARGHKRNFSFAASYTF